MGKTITAIKTCLEKNENLLDSLLYPEDSHFEFYKKNGNDKTWWIDSTDKIGEHLSSFDKKRIKNICEVIPGIAKQVIIFIKDTDGDIAQDYMMDKVGITYKIRMSNPPQQVDNYFERVGEADV